jgi:hypothetical protein
MEESVSSAPGVGAVGALEWIVGLDRERRGALDDLDAGIAQLVEQLIRNQ